MVKSVRKQSAETTNTGNSVKVVRQNDWSNYLDDDDVYPVIVETFPELWFFCGKWVRMHGRAFHDARKPVQLTLFGLRF